MTDYLFTLVCPRCGKQAEFETPHRVPPPMISCGDCLYNDVEVVNYIVADVKEIKPDEVRS